MLSEAYEEKAQLLQVLPLNDFRGASRRSVASNWNQSEVDKKSHSVPFQLISVLDVDNVILLIDFIFMIILLLNRHLPRMWGIMLPLHRSKTDVA